MPATVEDANSRNRLRDRQYRKPLGDVIVEAQSLRHLGERVFCLSPVVDVDHICDDAHLAAKFEVFVRK